MAERNPSDDQAAFGVFPQLKRNRAKQDREAAKNVPIDLARGALAGVLGAPGDIESLIRMLPYLNEKTVLPTSEDIEKRLPLRSETPVSKAATGLGILGGGFYTGPLSPLRVAGAIPSALKHGAQEFAKASVAGAPHVVKPTGKANWLSGPNIHVPEGDLWRFKTQSIAGETPAQRIPHHEELLKDPTLNQDQLDRVRYQLDQTKGEAALDNWVDTALMGYFKGQLASPNDPIRLLIEKNYATIEAKFAKDQERAARMAQRAEAEVDPRRKGNMERQAKAMMAQARDDRDLAMQNISHLPPETMEDIFLDPKSYIKEERVKAGFPAEGMATSEPARKWEHQADEAVKVTRAGDIQAALDLQPRLDKALQEQYAVYQKMNEAFGNYLRDKGLDENSVQALLKSMPRSDKAETVGMLDELQRVDSNYLRLLDQDRSFPKFAAQDNPQIASIDPETKMYSGYMGELGFEHVMDVLRQDVAAGRIRPDQLNKLSVEQAIRRTQEYNLERAKTMRDAKIKQQEGFPTHKEYPEGYKWIELAPPKELPAGYSVVKDDMTGSFKVVDASGKEAVDRPANQLGHTNVPFHKTEEEAIADALKYDKRLEEALKYEGDTMGHCVGGYCPDVAEGRSRIYSLRDTKGEPHVTIEVQPQNEKGYYNSLNPTERAELMNKAIEYRRQTVPDWDEMKNPVERADMLRDYLQAQNIEIPSRIVQIKGKQNARPIQKYDPYTQDFVKSGSWSEVGDLKNTGLQKFGSEYLTNLEAESKYKPMVADALNYLETHPSLERHRAARLARNNFKGDVTSPEYRDLERQAGESIAKDVPYTYAELKALLSSPEDWVDRGETIYTPISTAIQQIEKAKKSLGPLPPAPEMKRGGKVSISKNPDTMMLAVNNQKLAGGGLAKLLRAAPKSAEEIKTIAERMAPQMLGEFVRGDKGTQSVAGKTQKQFAKEKEMVHDIRPTGAERPLPKPVDIEQLKGNVVIGIPGDPTISGQTVHSIGGIPLESPSPQHGGPLYGLGRDDAFWASGLGAANRVQNLAREAGMQYDAPVLGKYIMMGPESINYAQHFADANLAAIDPSKMTKAQIESFNNLVREGYPYKKKGEDFTRQRVFPAFPGIESPAEAYLHFSIDPELRKHFNALMQMPTVTEKHGLPSGIDVRHAITEPDLRDLETGVTGKSIGRMKPEVTKLGLSEHPTYSHDIPGEFLGSSKYPIPYELSFPDTLKSIRENPKQASHEFGTLKMVGPRQIIDQQMIDEIKQYEEHIKRLTGKKKGGTVHKTAGGAITGDDLIIEERPL